MTNKCVCMPLRAHACVCCYRLNPQCTIENNGEHSIISVHQMQRIFPQLSPFSVFPTIRAHPPMCFAVVVLKVCRKDQHNTLRVRAHTCTYNTSSLARHCSVMLLFKKLIFRSRLSRPASIALHYSLRAS